MQMTRLAPWLAAGAFLILAAAILAPGGAVILDSAANGASLWQWLVATIFLEQQALHRELAGAVREVGADGAGFAAAWGLVAISFLYGVFHAAGPGHGKAILTTYLLAEGTERRRGLMLAFASSMAQGAVAAIAVYGLIYLAGLLPRDARGAMSWSERASFLLVMALGLWVLFRALRSLRQSGHVHHPEHAHHHHHHHHDHDHHHGQDGACCDHAHGPDLQDIRKAGSLRGAVTVILSIGLRPCTGAMLVLILAQAAGIAWAGLLSVFAMSFGTALAIAGLAWATVSARDWVIKLPSGSLGVGLKLGAIAGVAGGIVLVALGANLLWASMGPQHPLGL